MTFDAIMHRELQTLDISLGNFFELQSKEDERSILRNRELEGYCIDYLAEHDDVWKAINHRKPDKATIAKYFKGALYAWNPKKDLEGNEIVPRAGETPIFLIDHRISFPEKQVIHFVVEIGGSYQDVDVIGYSSQGDRNRLIPDGWTIVNNALPLKGADPMDPGNITQGSLVGPVVYAYRCIYVRRAKEAPGFKCGITAQATHVVVNPGNTDAPSFVP